jgi:multidrug efflux pump subunit AcrA (membrane-fusion protein)
MKKTTTILSLTLSLILFVTACGAAKTTVTPSVPTPAPATVIAAGHLVPNQSVYLAFLASGRVEQVLVQKGDHVTQGQVLATLGDREQAAAALAGAQAQLLAAQQAYDTLQRTSELALAQALQAYLKTQATRAAAQLAWDKLDLNAIQTDIDTAQADVTSRLTDVENAQKDLAKYSNVPANNATRKSYEDKLRTAQTDYDSALLKLVNLTSSRDSVKAAYNAAVAAEAEAKRTYENTQNGPNKDQFALVQAQLDLAKAQAAAAQSALDNYTLKAPFSGTVANVNISAYQMVSPQTWAVALADTSLWYVDTSDLTEMDVVKVNIGESVKVTADALPGVTMTGVVKTISTAPLLQSGDVLYTVHILLNDPDPALLWGMTMEVAFTP